jgi:Sel1 repeat
LILNEIDGSLPGPFLLFGDKQILRRPIRHEVTVTSLGFSIANASRTDFLLYASRYAFAPGELIPLYCAASDSEELELVAVHDATTHALVHIQDLARGIFSGSTACGSSDALGCAFPKVCDLDTGPVKAGIFIVNIITRSGRVSQPLFILLRESRKDKSARIGLMHPDFTWQAYNSAGGSSLYVQPNQGRLFSASLLRPLDQRAVYDYHNARVCVPYKRFFDTLSTPCRHFSNHDLHEDGSFLDGLEILVLCGHDEYWTKDIRRRIDGFVARGGRIACFSGNTNWWQVNLVDDTLYKSQEKTASTSPNYTDTGKMLSSWINNPVDSLIGLGYLPGGYAVRYYHSEESAIERGLTLKDYEASRGVTVVEPEHPIFYGTQLTEGSTFGTRNDIMTVEVDAAYLRADGALDRTRWKHTPRNLKVLGRTLIYNANFPARNNDPEGMFQVGAVLAEVPGRGQRGAVIHFGCLGWYRAVAAKDPVSLRIISNTLNYLLSDPKEAATIERRRKRAPLKDAELPPGMADIDRRWLVGGAMAASAAAILSSTYLLRSAIETKPVGTDAGQARSVLARWVDLRKRSAEGDASALEELATQLLNEGSIGSETFVEILDYFEQAGANGNHSALIQRFLLASERLNGLNPSSAELDSIAFQLRSYGNPILVAVRKLEEEGSGALQSLRSDIEKLALKSEAAKILLAVEFVSRVGSVTEQNEAEAHLLKEPKSALALTLNGQILELLGKDKLASLSLLSAAKAGYTPADVLIARSKAIKGKTPEVRSNGLRALMSIGSKGSMDAVETASEIVAQKAQTLSDLAPYLAGLKVLADNGNINAAYLSALLFAVGIESEPEPDKALYYMQLCAQGGHPEAEYYLGVWAINGYVKSADRVAARQWFEEAARHGEARSMFNLGLMLNSGDGGLMDARLAKYWFKRAELTGLAEAAEWIRQSQ